MARYLKVNSDSAKRRENVIQTLAENEVEIEYLGGEYFVELKVEK